MRVEAERENLSGIPYQGLIKGHSPERTNWFTPLANAKWPRQVVGYSEYSQNKISFAFVKCSVSKPAVENISITEEREKIITFGEIFYDKQRIKLKSPITVRGVVADKVCSIYFEPLDIFVSSPTLDDCVEDFQEALYVLYEEYAREVDEKLTNGARELKRKLLELVG